MSWPEAFAIRYEDWSAQMTEDVPFYVERSLPVGPDPSASIARLHRRLADTPSRAFDT
jgi:hypothetical protein